MKKLKIKSVLIFKSLFIVAVLSFTCVGFALADIPYAGPDEYGYTAWEIFPSNLRYISESGTATSVPLDYYTMPVSDAIPIGFSFNFYGTEYDHLYISCNGFVTFTAGTDSGAGFLNRPLPDNDYWNNLIAPFWDDLFLSPYFEEGYILYETLGTPGNREFVVGFYNVYSLSYFSSVTFELILHEASGNIELQYLEVPIYPLTDGSKSRRPTIGIENADGSIGLQIDFSDDVDNLNQGFLIVPPQLFADFTVKKAEIEFKDGENKDKFKVKGRFVLDENSDGIDPVTQEVSITVGTVTLVIPPESFEEKRSHFEFKGVIGGADVKMKIKKVDLDTFDFDVHAKDVDLSYTSNPTDIVLSVGLVSGSTQIRLKKKLEYKSGH